MRYWKHLGQKNFRKESRYGVLDRETNKRQQLQNANNETMAFARERKRTKRCLKRCPPLKVETMPSVK
ncbi:hypothetical protein BDV95DRAFT_583854 [Massariosphaeria phaeospora]|uniref:Uncharacterized protein n=1 Tax=Massariosphaeria phaeospora TaxID=100035 RepID=A0A7C8I1K8_9PLEO|nr:hypothetical protein BDV95DRAFT_583854 [Massariosphaeria phaeospora]